MNLIYTVIFRGLVSVNSLLNTILIAKFYGVLNFGFYSLVLTFVLFCSFFPGFGLTHTSSKLLADLNDKSFNQVFSNILSITFFSGLFGLVFLIIIFSIYFKSGVDHNISLILSFFIFNEIIRIFESSYLVKNKMKKFGFLKCSMLLADSG